MWLFIQQYIVYIIVFVSESKSCSHVQLFSTPWTIQSMEFSRPEFWSGYPFPSPGYPPNAGIQPMYPTLQVDYLPAELSEKLILLCLAIIYYIILMYNLLYHNQLDLV